MNTIPQSACPGTFACLRHDDDPHVRLASEQSSMHNARGAIARWRSGNTDMEWLGAMAISPSPQSRWHAAAQRDFCAWLDAGGFTQADASDSTASATQPELSCLHYE